MKKKVFLKIFVWKNGVFGCKLVVYNVLSVLSVGIDVGVGFSYNIEL